MVSIYEFNAFRREVEEVLKKMEIPKAKFLKKRRGIKQYSFGWRTRKTTILKVTVERGYKPYKTVEQERQDHLKEQETVMEIYKELIKHHPDAHLFKRFDKYPESVSIHYQKPKREMDEKNI